MLFLPSVGAIYRGGTNGTSRVACAITLSYEGGGEEDTTARLISNKEENARYGLGEFYFAFQNIRRPSLGCRCANGLAPPLPPKSNTLLSSAESSSSHTRPRCRSWRCRRGAGAGSLWS